MSKDLLNSILERQASQAPFNIEPQLRRIQNLEMEYPVMFDKLHLLSREDVKEIVSSSKHSFREKLFAILLWGIYFEVVQRRPKLSLLDWINQNSSEVEIAKRFKAISESNSPSMLFRSFQNELKIPGLDFAYFTKIFYFVRSSEGRPVFPILDKWLMCAFTAISGQRTGTLDIFNAYMRKSNKLNFDGGIRRRKPECYEKYVEFMTNISKEKNIDIGLLEEKLFGVDFRCDGSMQNPRNMYRAWASEQGLSIN